MGILDKKTDSRSAYTPIFGTYCRTCAFEPEGLEDQENACHIEYREAYQTDAAKGTWAVNLITTQYKEAGPRGQKTLRKITEPTTLSESASFEEAMKLLADFENLKRSDKTGVHNLVGESAEELGWSHYFAFTVREGFVFDVLGRPYQRPSRHALPTGNGRLELDADLLEEANKIWATVVDQKEQPAPLPIMSQTLLHEMFNRAASEANFDDAMNNRQAMHDMDVFFDLMNKASKSMETYIKEYQELGKGSYIFNDNKSENPGAVQYLEQAEKQLESVSETINVADYIDYVKQCQITAHLIHIQGVADLNNREIFQTSFRDHEYRATADEQRKENLKTIQAKRKLIAKIYKDMGADKEELHALDAAAAKTGGPEMPENMTTFINLYYERREEYQKQLDQNKAVNPQSLMPPAGKSKTPQNSGKNKSPRP